MKKILIVNFGPAKNNGSKALILSQVEALASAGYPKNNISISAFSKEDVKLDEKEISVLDNPGGNYVKSIRKISLLLRSKAFYFLSKLGIKNPEFILNEEGKKINSYDIVMNTGGDAITGDYGIGGLICVLSNLYIPYFLNKEIVFFGETLGPFKNRLGRLLSMWIIRRSKAIYAREGRTLEILKKLGLPKKIETYQICDPAFLLTPKDQKTAEQLLKKESIPLKKNGFIGISFSYIIHRYLSDNIPDSKKKEHFLNNATEFVDWLVESEGKNVLLIAHVTCKDDNDQITHREILERAKHKDKIFMTKKEYGAREVKAIIGLSEIFIGCRMHSLIAATSQYVPTLPIAYSHKTKGIIGDFLGLQDYIMDTKNDLTFKQYKKLYLKVKQDKKIIREKLKKKVPIAQKLVLDGARKLLEITNN